MVRRLFVWSLVLSVVVAGPAWGQITKQVRATGEAAGTGANAVEDAKNQALRLAVEQACGTFINAQTEVENFETIFDQVLADTAGYVSKYSIVGEPVKTEDGTTKVTVLATVSTVKFERAWAQAKIVIERAGNPRCIIVLTEQKSPDAEPRGDGIVQGIWEQFFLSKGVQLMDQGVADSVKERDVVLAEVVGDDVNRVAALGAQFQADVVIVGQVTVSKARSFELQGRTVHEYAATANYRAVRSDDAQILASDSVTVTEKTMRDGNTDAVLRKLGDATDDRVLKQIVEAWRQRQQGGTIVRLSLDGVELGDWEDIEAALKELDGVTQVRLRELTVKTATIEINTRNTAMSLAKRLNKLAIGSQHVEVTETSGNRVSGKLQ